VRPFGVTFQVVTMTWVSAKTRLVYHSSGADNVVEIQVRATSPAGYEASFGVSAYGACTAENTTVTEPRSALLTMRVTLTDPASSPTGATCQLTPYLDSDVLANSQATVRVYDIGTA
jgi:hypothetical protein